MASTGWIFATVASQITGVWTTPNNILDEDDDVATFTTTTKNDNRILEAQTFGFDALIPTDSTINAVDLRARAAVTSGGSNRFYLRLSGVDGAVHTVTDAGLTTNTFAAETRPGGGGWTRADVLDGVLTARLDSLQPNNTVSRTYQWAWVEIQIDYTEPAPPTPPGLIPVSPPPRIYGRGAA